MNQFIFQKVFLVRDLVIRDMPSQKDKNNLMQIIEVMLHWI